MDNPDLVLLASKIDLRVGKIISIQKHPNADSLYIEEVDFGTHTKTIVSGLVPHFPESSLLNRLCIFLYNIKPIRLRGTLSEGMILVGRNDSTVELLTPPEHAIPGDKVLLGPESAPVTVLNPKDRVFEQISPHLAIKDKTALFLDKYPLHIPEKGVVTVESLTSGSIS